MRSTWFFKHDKLIRLLVSGVVILGFWNEIWDVHNIEGGYLIEGYRVFL